MQHRLFFGGTMKQNTNVAQNSYTLDLLTGGDALKPKKKLTNYKKVRLLEQ